jgi:site-specific recombinase
MNDDRSQPPKSDSTASIAKLAAEVRPRANARDATANLELLCEALAADPERLRALAADLRAAFRELRLHSALVESGIRSELGLSAELRRTVAGWVLPPVLADGDLRAVLPRVFSSSNDWRWVQAIPTQNWRAFLCSLLSKDTAEGLPHPDVGTAIRVLVQRIGATGTDADLREKLSHVTGCEPAFLELSIDAHRFLEDHREGLGSAATYDAFVARLHECRRLIRSLRENKQELGTSLHLSSATRRLLQQLERVELLAHMVRPSSTDDFAESLVPVLQALVKAQQTGHSIRRIVGDNIDLLAFQVTEHTATKGEKYVASSAAEYRSFLLAAMGGGALVAVFAVIKLFLGKLALPLAAQALVYGLNYGVCFTLIYLTGAILATKQPAVTASTIARKIDEAKDDRDALDTVAETVILIWRSQFVSFVGNLVCAFPVAIGIAYGLEKVLSVEAASEAKVKSLLLGNHPWESLALYYAAVAGVFLFLSGVIQGVVENRIVYTNLGDRLARDARLGLSRAGRERLARFAVDNLSGIVANVALGMLLGSAGVVGEIFGLPLDIRHIAFSSAHLGVAVLDAPQLVDSKVIYAVTLGVFGIGLVNFVVSFGLTLAVTLKSRRVLYQQASKLPWLLFKRFLRRPHRWLLPID